MITASISMTAAERRKLVIPADSHPCTRLFSTAPLAIRMRRNSTLFQPLGIVILWDETGRFLQDPNRVFGGGFADDS